MTPELLTLGLKSLQGPQLVQAQSSVTRRRQSDLLSLGRQKERCISLNLPLNLRSLLVTFIVMLSLLCSWRRWSSFARRGITIWRVALAPFWWRISNIYEIYIWYINLIMRLLLIRRMNLWTPTVPSPHQISSHPHLRLQHLSPLDTLLSPCLTPPANHHENIGRRGRRRRITTLN